MLPHMPLLLEARAGPSTPIHLALLAPFSECAGAPKGTAGRDLGGGNPRVVVNRINGQSANRASVRSASIQQIRSSMHAGQSACPWDWRLSQSCVACPASQHQHRRQQQQQQQRRGVMWQVRAQAQTATKEKGGGKKKGGGGGRGGGAPGSGFGKKAAPKAPQGPDAQTLLRRSEQEYVRMLEDYHQWEASQGKHYSDVDSTGASASDGQRFLVREFVVCVRATASGQGNSVDGSGGDGGGAVGGGGRAGRGNLLSDWLPVAELLLQSEMEAAAAIPAALPFVCRELAECAAEVLGPSLPRHLLEYAYETAESFYEEVLPSALGVSSAGGDGDSAEDWVCPYTTLGLKRGASLAEIRAAYRSLAAAHHPDRHEDGHKEAAEERFKTVAKAYDTLRSGNGSASRLSGPGDYGSLGGTKRAGLSDAIQVKAKVDGEKLDSRIRIAVRPLEPEMVEVFLARLAKRSRSTASA